MDHRITLYQWRDELKRQLTALSQPQATELALWSLGMVLARHASLSAVSSTLAAWLGGSVNTLRQQLREWYLPAARKRGTQRVSLDPQHCFCDLAAWVLSLLPSKRIALALDASTQKDTLTVLCVSVLIWGCAIPISWRILPGNEPEHWKAHWLALLAPLAAAFPPDRFVVVLTDRGLWAPWLFLEIQRHGWHPLMRISAKGAGRRARYFQQQGGSWKAISSFAPLPGKDRLVVGRAFKKHLLPCRLIAFLGTSAKEPWYLLTDLAVDHGCWYGARFWIEHQFKQIKSDGWHWEQSRIKKCDRAERMWLAYAVGLLWTQSFGSDAEKTDQFDEGWLKLDEGWLKVPPGSKQPSPQWEQPRRRISLFAKGLAILGNLIAQNADVKCPRFAPTYWLENWAINNTT
ncbi:MAG TPA: hypothetical protein VHA37_06615 [Candidatus Saccharimonadales bacterium]|nr:hypothetical protein [Candidatus Saccharimonadales bacterium]